VGSARLRSLGARSPDPHPDPFAERKRLRPRVSRQLLGACLHFQTASAELLRLVHWAYDDLPEHELPGPAPHLNVHLVLNEAAAPNRPRTEPPGFTLMSGAGLLGAVAGPASVVVMSPAQGEALVTVSREMLEHPYHARYELIELAVFTLATRVQQLLPLHAACVSLNDRGLLLMGDSGAGKSTLSLHCLRRQLDFVSEDAVFVTAKGLLATGVANFLHVRADTLRGLPKQEAGRIRAFPTIRRRSGVRKFEIDLRRLEVRLAPRPPRLSAAVFLSPRSGGGNLLRPLSGKDVSARLLASQRYAAGQPEWRQFASNLREIGGYELRRGRHPQDGAERLHELLATGA
jgi:hypothetical protein